MLKVDTEQKYCSKCSFRKYPLLYREYMEKVILSKVYPGAFPITQWISNWKMDRLRDLWMHEWKSYRKEFQSIYFHKKVSTSMEKIKKISVACTGM